MTTWVYPREGEPYVKGEHRYDGVIVIGDSHYDIGDPRFNSRATHRRYMKDNGLTLTEEFKGDWERAAKEREAFYTRAPDPQRVLDIAQAFEKVRQGYRPRRQEEL